ncbi:MAG: hypothetical protein AAGJ40_12375 [Planctomycetota bacterium]
MNLHRVFGIAAWSLLSLSYLVEGDACAATIGLSGNDHTGYFALSGVNTEDVEPESGLPGSKNLDTPFFFNTNAGIWDYIVAVPLITTNDYSAFSTSVSGNGINDPNFSQSDFGSISYNASGLTNVGPESLGFTAGDVNLDLFDFGPANAGIYGLHNPGNEFAWDFAVESLSAQGSPTLMFQDGDLISIDGVFDVGLAVRLGTSDLGKFLTVANGPVATYDGTLTFAGDQFAFAIDSSQDVFAPFFGQLTGTRLFANRSGTISAAVAIPEPSALITLVFASVMIACGGRTRVSQQDRLPVLPLDSIRS